MNFISLLESPGPDRIAAKYALGYSAVLDHGSETLTLLDQASSDMRSVESFNGRPYPSFAEVTARIVSATQTGRAPVWADLRLPDAIRAHGRAFPHAFNQVKMPDFLKAWIVRRFDNDACLITSEVAFQAACAMTGESFSLIRAMEERIQYLEKERYKHDQ